MGAYYIYVAFFCRNHYLPGGKSKTIKHFQQVACIAWGQYCTF